MTGRVGIAFAKVLRFERCRGEVVVTFDDNCLPAFRDDRVVPYRFHDKAPVPKISNVQSWNLRVGIINGWRFGSRVRVAHLDCRTSTPARREWSICEIPRGNRFSADRFVNSSAANGFSCRGFAKPDGGNRFSSGGCVKSSAGNHFSGDGLAKSTVGNHFSGGGFVKSTVGNRFSSAGFIKSIIGNRFSSPGCVKSSAGNGFSGAGFAKSTLEITFPVVDL